MPCTGSRRSLLDQDTSGIVTVFFGVTIDGALDVPARFAGFASTDGGRLAVRGCEVGVDARSRLASERRWL